MKRVAIIGFGPAGIAALKTSKEYGHKVTCFEREASFGGTWNIKENMNIGYESFGGSEYGLSPGYSLLRMNTSGVMSEFSDFPTDRPFHFHSHSEYLKYLKKYIAHFDLMKHILFDSTVTQLEKKGKEWLVAYTSLDKENKYNQVDVFDFVIIATGSFRFPILPIIPGIDSFEGLVVHSGQVRNEAKLFKDKVIMVIGAGHSGFELTSAALSSKAKKVYMSTPKSPKRRKRFIGDRFVSDPRQNGRLTPYDVYGIHWYGHERGATALKEFYSFWVKPVNYSASPNHFAQPPNDSIIISEVDFIDEMESNGMLEKVEDVVKIRSNQIELENNQVVSNVDIILCATGFNCSYPMLNNIWDVADQGKCELYRHMISPDAKMDGLVFLITADTLSGSLMPALEMQARFACESIFIREYCDNGEIFTIKEREYMNAEIDKERAANLQYNRSFNFVVDIHQYQKQLALEMGCVPLDSKVLLQHQNQKEDIELGVALYYGPIISSQYRLLGPKSWDGARQHILDVAKEALGCHFDELVKKHLTENFSKLSL